MCTVTYVPGQEGIILTSNRDESPERSPKNITRLIGRFNICFPQDTLAGGTWIASDDRGRMICVMNGAFVKHAHNPPYRKSRGILALEYFNLNNVIEFAQQNFEGIEPFTLVIVEEGSLFELRWDEQRLHNIKLDATAMYIWSSATLYDKLTREKRSAWFDEWKTHKDYTLESIQKFHLFGGEKDPINGFVMNRNDIVRTVSITSVILRQDKISMHYHELLKDLKDEISIPIKETIANE